VTGFIEKLHAVWLLSRMQNAHPYNFILLKVHLASEPDSPILEGTGGSMGQAFADTKILAAPMVVSIEEIDDPLNN
jgi:hypothetical protein